MLSEDEFSEKVHEKTSAIWALLYNGPERREIVPSKDQISVALAALEVVLGETLFLASLGKRENLIYALRYKMITNINMYFELAKRKYEGIRS